MSDLETSHQQAPSTRMRHITMSATPRCSSLEELFIGLTGWPDFDDAVAEYVAHLAGAPVENFAGLERGAAAAFTERDGYPRADAHGFARAGGERFAVHPGRGGAARALHVAVDRGRWRGDRCGGGPVGDASFAPRIKLDPLLGREEEPPELLRERWTGRQGERNGDERQKAWFHRFAARSMIVMRSISHSARSRGVIVVPVAA